MKRRSFLKGILLAGAAPAIATRLAGLKKALGGSGNLVLTTTERAARSPMGDEPTTPRQKVVILGFDGMDPALVRAFMSDGKLPAFRKLAGLGGRKPAQPNQIHQSSRVIAWAKPGSRSAGWRWAA